MKKRVLSLILATVIVRALAVPVAAYDMGKPGECNIISDGPSHTAAIDERGTLWTWGLNNCGQLGNGGGVNAEDEHGTPIQTVPVRVLDNVAAVSCGDNNTAAVKTDGTLWTWGRNYHGELGNGGGGNTENEYGEPLQTVPVQVMDSVSAVSRGDFHTAIIKTDSTLWTWGGNYDGELGNGTVPLGEYSNVPVYVMDNVAAVNCGYSCTAAIKTDGTLWMWGRNFFGQLGNGGGGNAKDEYGLILQTVPVQVLDNVVAVSCGGGHTSAIKTDGTLWMWGLNDYGQLGNGGGGNVEIRNGVPCQTVPVQVMDNVVAVSCGESHTAALRTDGTLWTWGMNYSGRLGNGTVGRGSSVPVQVMDNVAAVSCGDNNTAAVKTDGTLWTWGLNYYGQLGNGATEDSNVPIQITLGGGQKVKMPTGGATPTAYPSTQSVLVDGRAIEFQCYALKDENGNDTNYIKLRDLAILLNGTEARFEVGWNGDVTITTKKAYTPNGSELSTPFSGQRAYEKSGSATVVDGVAAELDAIVLTDDNGGGYTYYKLRDLGNALGFKVDWSADKGIYIETK